MRVLIRFALATAATSLLVWMVAIFAERPLLSSYLVPLSGMRLAPWVNDFMNAAAHGVWISAAGSAFWFSLARWLFGVLDWRSSGRRTTWTITGLITVTIATVYGFYYVPSAESGGVIAYSFFFANSVLIYYVSTVMGSPPSYKYTPVGARVFRVF
jgi:hypothetical protein